jgi:hypothetical protein
VNCFTIALWQGKKFSIDPAAPGASHLNARLVGRPTGLPESPVEEPADGVGNGLHDPSHGS